MRVFQSWSGYTVTIYDVLPTHSHHPVIEGEKNKK